MDFTPEELETCLKVLQIVARDPACMNEHGRFKQLVAKIHRLGKKGKKTTRRNAARQQDRQAVRETGLVRQQSGAQRLGAAGDAPETTYRRPRPCYICKQPFQQVHAFYHLLCPDCAELNWDKRQQRADLTGKVAIVTGGRIKIGYQTALMLLRDGARVIVTTRFPRDAWRRFLQEPDSAVWSNRLQVSGLDLRDLPAVEAFARTIQQQESRLDILIHNAAQTVKRPLAFYRHLLEAERQALPAAALIAAPEMPILLEARPGYRGEPPEPAEFFPLAVFDVDGQQLDRRPLNSWRLKLGEVQPVELLEAFLVTTLAPFMLTNRWLPLLEASPAERKFIVHVSAMEGQFGREYKTPHHPHTNMAKAAMNMLTRTAAADLAARGIYLNSVDTGWITDEKPLPAAERVREEENFHPPLDAVDGAARVYDPIVRGCNEPEPPPHGHFLKNYFPFPW